MTVLTPLPIPAVAFKKSANCPSHPNSRERKSRYWGEMFLPPSTAVGQRSLPTCSVANYVLHPCTLIACLCTPSAVCAAVSASVLRTRHTDIVGDSSGRSYVTEQWHDVPLLCTHVLIPSNIFLGRFSQLAKQTIAHLVPSYLQCSRSFYLTMDKWM